METRGFGAVVDVSFQRSRKAERHSGAALAVHRAWSLDVSPVRGRVGLARDESPCTRQTGCAGRAALRRVGGSTFSLDWCLARVLPGLVEFAIRCAGFGVIVLVRLLSVERLNRQAKKRPVYCPRNDRNRRTR